MTTATSPPNYQSHLENSMRYNMHAAARPVGAFTFSKPSRAVIRHFGAHRLMQASTGKAAPRPAPPPGVVPIGADSTANSPPTHLGVSLPQSALFSQSSASFVDKSRPAMPITPFSRPINPLAMPPMLDCAPGLDVNRITVQPFNTTSESVPSIATGNGMSRILSPVLAANLADENNGATTPAFPPRSGMISPLQLPLTPHTLASPPMHAAGVDYFRLGSSANRSKPPMHPALQSATTVLPPPAASAYSYPTPHGQVLQPIATPGSGAISGTRPVTISSFAPIGGVMPPPAKKVKFEEVTPTQRLISVIEDHLQAFIRMRAVRTERISLGCFVESLTKQPQLVEAVLQEAQSGGMEKLGLIGELSLIASFKMANGKRLNRGARLKKRNHKKRVPPPQLGRALAVGVNILEEI
eukprot:Lankesteria_metandrocarpae@DN3702_c0_g1_i2.p1